MNWEAVGAISQIVGAVLVGITLIYLAVQLRQNTSALKSSTFLAISTLMGSTMEVWATHSDLAPLLIKAQAGLDELSPDERGKSPIWILDDDGISPRRNRRRPAPSGFHRPRVDRGLRTVGVVSASCQGRASMVGRVEECIQQRFLSMGR